MSGRVAVRPRHSLAIPLIISEANFVSNLDSKSVCAQAGFLETASFTAFLMYVLLCRFVDEELRVGRDDKGNIFLLRR